MSTAAKYRIVKFPINKDKSVFYYYKPFRMDEFNEEIKNNKSKDSIIDIDPAKSIYLCHFNRAIDPAFINKYFGQIGKIKQINLGSFRNKSTNSRRAKRRTIYYAIIIFKDQRDALQICQPTGAKLMQTIINKTLKKNAKYATGIFGASDDEESEIDDEAKNQRQEMEDGGYTIVTSATDNLKSKKAKVSDGIMTTMGGFNQEEGQRVYKDHIQRDQDIIGLTQEEVLAEKNRVFQEGNEDSEALKGLNLQNFISGDQNKYKKGRRQDMYAFQEREQKKNDLEKLRDDFEVYKKRMMKRMEKDKNRQKALLQI